MAPRTGTAAYLHNGRQDGYQRLERTLAFERCQSTRRVHQLGVQTRHGTNVREPSGIGLLRKEVIQPHLPVRLPCYDFTPIANPTFGSSVPEGSATDFGCCQLSWCDGRCVQGPGTYSPRRC